MRATATPHQPTPNSSSQPTGLMNPQYQTLFDSRSHRDRHHTAYGRAGDLAIQSDGHGLMAGGGEGSVTCHRMRDSDSADPAPRASCPAVTPTNTAAPTISYTTPGPGLPERSPAWAVVVTLTMGCFAVVALATWWYPGVELDAQALTIRNPLRTIVVPHARILKVDNSGSYVRIRTTDRTYRRAGL